MPEPRLDIVGRPGTYPLSGHNKGTQRMLGDGLMVLALKLSAPFTIYLEDRKVDGLPGEYLVEFSDGSAAVKRAEQFS